MRIYAYYKTPMNSSKDTPVVEIPALSLEDADREFTDLGHKLSEHGVYIKQSKNDIKEAKKKGAKV